MSGSKNTFMEEQEKFIPQIQREETKITFELPLIAPKRSIYNIELDHLEIMAEIENNEGEITEEIAEKLELTIDEFETKATSYAYVIKHYDDELANIQNEVDRLRKIALSKINAREGVKGRIYAAMIRFNIDKVENNNIKLSFRKSQSLVIDEGAVIPDNYINVKEVETIDKKALKEAILEGSTFAGIYVSENKNLQIR
jgi:hypothetical protein